MNDPIGFVGLRCANPTYDTFQKKTQRTLGKISSSHAGVTRR